jgi:hypothetical protein
MDSLRISLRCSGSGKHLLPVVAGLVKGRLRLVVAYSLSYTTATQLMGDKWYGERHR